HLRGVGYPALRSAEDRFGEEEGGAPPAGAGALPGAAKPGPGRSWTGSPPTAEPALSAPPGQTFQAATLSFRVLRQPARWPKPARAVLSVPLGKRDLKDGPAKSIDRLLQGKARRESVPDDFQQIADNLAGGPDRRDAEAARPA